MRRVLFGALVGVVSANQEKGEVPMKKEDIMTTVDKQVFALQECWTHLSAGVKGAGNYASCFAPNVKFILNGEEDPVPWNDEEFLTAYFEQVQYRQPKVSFPPSIAESGTLFVGATTGVKVLSTQEDVDLGPAMYMVKFNDEMKIVEQSVLTDSSSLASMGEKLAPPSYDLRSVFDSYLNSYRNADADGLVGKYAEKFVMTRNGQKEPIGWNELEFLQGFFKEFGVKSLNVLHFANTGYRSVSTQLAWTLVNKKNGQEARFEEAQFVVFDQDGKINRLESTVDLREMMKIYSSMTDVMRSIAEKKAKEAQSRAQNRQGGQGGQGGPPGGR